MPKIIPELRERLIKKGRKLLLSGDPKAFSLRNISNECGIAVGTVYNYFTGKDQLIVAVLIDDWMKALEKMKKQGASAKSIEDGLSTIYDELTKFVETYKVIWSIFAKGEPDRDGVRAHHGELMGQLGECVTPIMEKFGKKVEKDEERLICELLVTAVLQSDITKESFIRFITK